MNGSLSRPKSVRASFVAPIAILVAQAAGNAARAQLPPPPEPPENPTTPQKAILGKALFWDEQLSSDNTMACGTCHRFSHGGGDPRDAQQPGPDGILDTDDDLFGSAGMLFADSGHAFQRSDFGFDRQVTPRRAPTIVTTQYFTEHFRDGRAPGQFVDPQTGNVSIASGGSLESQAVFPPLSTVEMGHDARDWAAVARKLARVTPLALSPLLSPDLSNALAGGTTYPDLFTAAFGDGAITAERIAFSLAAYERTLIADQTPWDAFNQGNTNALTPQQRRGLNVFSAVTIGSAGCANCHIPPLFTDDKFHNIGVRPAAEDIGREAVTGNAADRGAFRTPSVRNVGLRGRITHRGSMADIPAIIENYSAGGLFTDNIDPLINRLNLTAAQKDDLAEFVTNGLTDPRVALEQPPFDRPQLLSESGVLNPEIYGDESAGSGAFVPRMLAVSPPNLGNDAWALGVADGLGGAGALLALAADPANPGDQFNGIPLNIGFTPPVVFLPFVLSGTGAGDGNATFVFKIAATGTWLVGLDWYAQWFVADAAATGGFAASKGAKFTFF